MNPSREKSTDELPWDCQKDQLPWDCQNNKENIVAQRESIEWDVSVNHDGEIHEDDEKNSLDHKNPKRQIRIKATKSYSELSISNSNFLCLRDFDQSFSFNQPSNFQWPNLPFTNFENDVSSSNNSNLHTQDLNHDEPCSKNESLSCVVSTPVQSDVSKFRKLGDWTFPSSDDSSTSIIDDDAGTVREFAYCQQLSDSWYNQVYNIRKSKHWQNLQQNYEKNYSHFWVVSLVVLFIVIILSVGGSKPIQDNMSDSKRPFSPMGKGNSFWPVSFPLHINCGVPYANHDNLNNNVFTDSFGNEWVPDSFFLIGESEDEFGSVYQSKSCDPSSNKATNFLDDEILCTGRQFEQVGKYEIATVSPGFYVLSFFFYVDGEDNWWQQVFDIKIEGKTVFQKINPVHETSGKSNHMFRLGTVQEINSTAIQIEITPVVSSATIAGIKIMQAKSASNPNSLKSLSPSLSPKTLETPTADSVNAPPVTQTPVTIPSIQATPAPSFFKIFSPTQVPSRTTTDSPTAGTSTTSFSPTPKSVPREDIPKTYFPGNLTVSENGLILSEGLTAKIIGKAGQPVKYADGQQSAIPFHIMPDAGASFVDPRPWNVGGWLYVSNSEAQKVENGDQFPGGVGALTFDKDGQLIDYRMILEDTRMNCGGGPTPWGAWISGEEYGNDPTSANAGRVWQTDPTGERPAQRITLGETYPGMFESFAYDIRDKSQPRFFMTRDHNKVGDVRRWTPDSVDWDDPWNILLGSGTLEFLVVQPDPSNSDIGTFYWTEDWSSASENHKNNFPNTEGIDVVGDTLYFVSKALKSMFVLNLDDQTYQVLSTKSGLFQGQPDQLIRLFDQAQSPLDGDSVLYMTEDGGKYAGVHGRTSKGDYITILESHEYADETTGLAFSPDAKHMYVAYQDNGLLFDVYRVDGYPFNAETLDVKYHSHESIAS